MSANSPRHVMRCVPTVSPQAVNDRSIYDSVAGFIDVALANVPQGDPKDAILWVKFEDSADLSDLCYGDDWDLEGRAPPPLLLILGYVTGIQVWAIPANGEAFEVLSWRFGSVKTLRILPTPQPCDFELADEPVDQFTHKRPLMAICDNSSSSGTSASSTQQFCGINLISLKTKEQVKTIKFKNPIIEILANRTSIAITFPEKIAVFDARTLEDRLTITACHPSPGLNPNPVALGPRWMAYGERRLIPSKRSSGGCDYDGVSSYTATVLNAAKSLGKGLRELGETVAAGLSGNASHHGGTNYASIIPGTSQNALEKRQPGVITILDIKYPITDSSPVSGAPVSSTGEDRIIAHFVAHSDAVVALSFDYSGMLLVSADKRGHDFHVFRIHGHPGGPSMSAVHHLYVLHRGDTSSKVQDICISLDSRWVSVSTLRGTTHVFPITPYGGPAGVRTHGSSHVVNRLSRFHRSAGLAIDNRSSSPISHAEFSFSQSTSAYPNPRTPPFPHPTVVSPLAQLRQPVNAGVGNPTSSGTFNKSVQGRQRVQSLSEESSNPLRVCSTFARPRAYLLDITAARGDPNAAKMHNKSNDSLFVMTAYGALVQYDLDPKPLSSVPKEKVCDDTAIELDVEAKAQWNLMRNDDSIEVQPPLPVDNILLKERLNDGLSYSDDHADQRVGDERVDDLWLSQVEIITHAGPHRRLWMGPQFMFKTYNTPSGASLSSIEVESVEIGVSATAAGNRGTRSNPVNIPPTAGRSGVSVLIESSSYSSIEQSPRLTQLHYEPAESNFSLGGGGTGDIQLREDLADAMRETASGSGVSLLDAGSIEHTPSNVTSSSTSSLSSGPSSRNTQIGSIAKVVNPLGTVTTVLKSEGDDIENEDDGSGDFMSDRYVHENCDEALFRPVVTVVNSKSDRDSPEKTYDKPASIGLELIVPVIEQKSNVKKTKNSSALEDERKKFDELSAQNKRKEKKKSPVVEKKVEKPKEKEVEVKVAPTPAPPSPEPPVSVSIRLTKPKKRAPNLAEPKPTVKPVSKAPSPPKCPSPPPTPPPVVQPRKKKEPKPEKIIDDDFPELCQIQDHFSIQESLTKNSDFILKTIKPSPNSELVIKPFVDDDDDDDDHLDFNIMKMEESVVVESAKDPEQFFDTRSCSKYDLEFPESIFTEPLAPLESFVAPFEKLSFKSDSPPALMNFESPKNDRDDDDDEDIEMETTLINSVLIDNIEKSASNTNSSSETEDSYSEIKKIIDQDDELQPLISATTTSSETTPNLQTSKAIVDTLPDNQKVDNKQQQNTGNGNGNNKKKSRKKKR